MNSSCEKNIKILKEFYMVQNTGSHQNLLRSAFVTQRQTTSHKVSRLANILQRTQTSLSERTTTASITIEVLPEVSQK